MEIKVTVDSTSELIEKLRDKKLDAVLVLNHGGDPMENDLKWAELLDYRNAVLCLEKPCAGT